MRRDFTAYGTISNTLIQSQLDFQKEEKKNKQDRRNI